MSLASPHDVASILGHTAATGIAVIFTKLMRYALMVDSPAIGSGANEIDGIVDSHVGQGLGKVVEGLLGKGLDHEDGAASLTDASTDCLALGLIEDWSTPIDEGGKGYTPLC